MSGSRLFYVFLSRLNFDGKHASGVYQKDQFWKTLHNALVSVSNGLLTLDLRSPSSARSLDSSLGRSPDHRSLGRSVARSLDRSVALSLGRSVARSLGRSFARSLGRSFVRSLSRSIARSFDRSIVRSLDRSVDRSIARSFHRSIAWMESRPKKSTLGKFSLLIWIAFNQKAQIIHHGHSPHALFANTCKFNANWQQLSNTDSWPPLSDWSKKKDTIWRPWMQLYDYNNDDHGKLILSNADLQPELTTRK